MLRQTAPHHRAGHAGRPAEKSAVPRQGTARAVPWALFNQLATKLSTESVNQRGSAKRCKNRNWKFLTQVVGDNYVASANPREPEVFLFSIIVAAGWPIWSLLACSIVALALGKDSVVIISADANASHQSVIAVMEAARLAGLMQVTFATQTTAQAGR